MFGGSRRRQPPAQPLTRETANPNAATAAAAVFMSRRDSNSSLSSAAAAAALRARPMTPTNVAEVQSKRAHRRSPSLTSLTGSVRGRRELTRTPSMGSMTERTFRSPSPARSPAPRELDVPPVPAMPSVDQIMANQQTNGRTKGTRGPVLQTQPFRTASQKMKDGQPSWFGGATTRESGSPRHADAAIHSATYVSEPRPGSVSPSINFSYPRSKALSPSPSLDDTLVYDPNSRRMIPKSELIIRSQSVREVPQKPKKKKQTTSKAGSHLSRGTVGGRTRAPALEQDQELEPQPEPQPSQQAEPQPEPAPAVAPEPTVHQPQDDAVKKKKKKKKKNKKATVQSDLTREDLPAEEAVMAAKPPPLDTEPSVPVTGVVQEDAGQEKRSQRHVSPAVAAVDATPAAEAKPQATPETSDTTSQRPQVRQARVHSESPARSTHFASSSTDQLAVKHEPPARSVSPRKSALKLSSQNRGVSPSDDGSEASGSRLLSPQEGEDPALARKKSVRVSWDDRNTVVVGEGVAPQETDSPMIPSPQTKKPWHNVVSKFTKKDNVNIAEDETMTPRPALPLFGSVREKKVRETEERPLVRPSERVFPAENGSAATGTGQSTDAVIGAAITQDLASRNAANISKYREPLPVSQSSTVDDHSQQVVEESSDDDLDTDATTEPDEVPESITSKGSAPAMPEAPSTPTKQVTAQPEHNGDVPSISVSQPSPRSHGSGEATPPGGFPDDQSESRNDDSDDDYDESDSSGLSTPTRSAGPGAAVGPGMTDIVEEDEEDRFSDAYEDLEEVDGEGFLSLDAVVDSPTSGMASKKKAQDKSVVPKAKESLEDEQEFFTPTKAPEPAPGSEDWENAKAYWKSLSVDRRRQLEVEALSETGDESNTPKKGFSEVSDGQPKKDPVTADVPQAERSYQIKPGTRWSEDEAVSDDVRDSNLAKRASILAATRPRAVESAMPKLRTSMRQSMRADAQGPSGDTGLERPGSMRKSMRTGPGHAKAPASRPSTTDGSNARSTLAAMPSTTSTVEMRQSLRSSRSNGDDLRPTLSASGRPSSYHHPPTAGPMSSHKRNLSSDEINSSVPIKPTLRRRGSGDSESSFKRKRSGTGDGHNFRMSMRASMREAPSLNDATTRFSLRSLSPPAFRRNSFSSLPPGTPSPIGGGPGRMRQSLRDRPASSSSRLKMGSFKRSSGIGKKSKTGSRFADSSDEDEVDGPSLFRSRFADSSDEDEPVVAVPKSTGLSKTLRNGKGSSFDGPGRDLDSPDLPGENEGLVQPKRGSLVNGQSSLGRSRSGRGTLEPVPQNDMPRPSTRRGSFMSILRRKKDHSDKISKGFGESAARKDTDLERTPEELADLRSNSLHKRGPSWPLPDEEGAGADTDAGVSRAKDPSRPSTSGGPSDSKKKSSLLRRRSTSQGTVGLRQPEVDMTEPVPDIPDAFVSGESAQHPAPRKKKFGALRKMFGIHD